MRDGQGAPNGGDEMPEIIEVVMDDDDDESSATAGGAPRSGARPAGADQDGGDSRVEELEGELAHLRELYLRKLAEFDNYRKRTEREKVELRKTGGEDVVTDLIPVLDNFERALQHPAEADPNGFRQGVEMIAKQLFDSLERKGLEGFDPMGQPFDPELHEAMQVVDESEAAPGTVVSVLAKGYVYSGRLVRPALVGVAGSATRGDSPPDDEEEAQ